MKKLLFTILLSAIALTGCDKEYHAPIAPTKILQDYVIGYWTIDNHRGEAFRIEENQFFHGNLYKVGKTYEFEPGPTFHLGDNDGKEISYLLEEGDYKCIVYCSMGDQGKLNVKQDIVSSGKVHSYVCTRLEGDVRIKTNGGFNPHPGT